MRIFLPLVIVLVVPGTSWAHGSIPGADVLFAGMALPLTAQAPALALLGLGLALGHQRQQVIERSWPIFALSLGTGILIVFGSGAGLLPDWPLFVCAFGAALLAATTYRLALVPALLLSASVGFLIGISWIPAAQSWGEAAIAVAGVILGANIALAYVSRGMAWLRSRFDRPWMLIGLRVAASWVAAISCLMFAFAVAA